MGAILHRSLIEIVGCFGGKAVCRLSKKINRKQSFAMFDFMAAIDQFLPVQTDV